PWVVPELSRREVGDLFGDRAVGGDLPADDGQHARDAVAALVVVQRVLARYLALADTLLADECAHAGPGEEDLVERRVRERSSRLLPQIAHVLLGCGGGRRIAVEIRVGRADDRGVEPRDDEKEPIVATREQHVGLLRGARRDEMDPLRQTKQWLRAASQPRDRARSEERRVG